MRQFNAESFLSARFSPFSFLYRDHVDAFEPTIVSNQQNYSHVAAQVVDQITDQLVEEPTKPATQQASFGQAEPSTEKPAQGHIAIQGVTKYFGKHKALDNVSLEIPPGSVTVILGPSGSGKSTLLRTINHLERVDEGFIKIDEEYIGYRLANNTLYELKERDILQQRRNVGFVFQNFNLFPHLTVLENLIEAPIAHKQLSKQAAKTRAFELLEIVGLRDKADAWPKQLSGGQQQRIAIARALALDPHVMLFDEPTSALDPELVGEVLDTIKKLAHSGKTLVVVTHEIGFAREIADLVVFMVDGKIVEQGSSEQVLKNPQHPRTQQFLSKVL